MDIKKLFLSDKWVQSTCNLARVWRYHGWNSILIPWNVKCFGSISRRSTVDVKAGAGNATGKTGAGTGAGAGNPALTIKIRKSAIKAAWFFSLQPIEPFALSSLNPLELLVR